MPLLFSSSRVFQRVCCLALLVALLVDVNAQQLHDKDRVQIQIQQSQQSPSLFVEPVLVDSLNSVFESESADQPAAALLSVQEGKAAPKARAKPKPKPKLAAKPKPKPKLAAKPKPRARAAPRPPVRVVTQKVVKKSVQQVLKAKPKPSIKKGKTSKPKLQLNAAQVAAFQKRTQAKLLRAPAAKALAKHQARLAAVESKHVAAGKAKKGAAGKLQAKAAQKKKAAASAAAKAKAKAKAGAAANKQAKGKASSKAKAAAGSKAKGKSGSTAAAKAKAGAKAKGSSGKKQQSKKKKKGSKSGSKSKSSGGRTQSGKVRRQKKKGRKGRQGKPKSTPPPPRPRTNKPNYERPKPYAQFLKEREKYNQERGKATAPLSPEKAVKRAAAYVNNAKQLPQIAAKLNSPEFKTVWAVKGKGDLTPEEFKSSLLKGGKPKAAKGKFVAKPGGQPAAAAPKPTAKQSKPAKPAFIEEEQHIMIETEADQPVMGGGAGGQAGGSGVKAGGSGVKAGGSGVKAGGSGVKAGGSGVKAGGSGVKAGGSGVKAGGSGVKAGGSGVKAGGSGVKAGGSGVKAGGSGVKAGGSGVKSGEAGGEAGGSGVKSGGSGVKSGEAGGQTLPVAFYRSSLPVAPSATFSALPVAPSPSALNNTSGKLAAYKTSSTRRSHINKFMALAIKPEQRPYLEKLIDRVPSYAEGQAPKGQGAISNQGSCASCWAHSAVDLLQFSLTHSKKRLRTISATNPLSIQYVVECSKGQETVDGSLDGCESGAPHAALSWMMSNGYAVNQRGLSEKDKQCGDFQRQSFNGEWLGWDDFPTDDYDPCPEGTTEKCDQAIYEPLLLDAIMNKKRQMRFFAYVDASQWQFYGSGMFPPSACSKDPVQGNHAVQIVGAGADQDGTLFWWIKNSWGGRWGMNGYARLPMGYNACGLMNYIGYVVLPGEDPEDYVELELSSLGIAHKQVSHRARYNQTDLIKPNLQ